MMKNNNNERTTSGAMKRLYRAAQVLGILGLAGCGALVKTPAAYTVYDLGSIEPLAVAPVIVPAAIEVRAPSWLASAAMQYRLDYVEPSSRASYAETRWAAPPAEMLQRMVAATLISVNNAPGTCRLRFDLDEFVQEFDSPERSHSTIFVRVSLHHGRKETVLSRRSFSVRVAAPAADARGGVQAHREGVRELTKKVVSWFATLESDQSAREVGIAEQCRSG